MTDHVTVELKLADQTLKLSTTEDKKPELLRAASLLNEKFDEMRRNAPRAEYYKLTLMVALQLMQEVLSLNKSLQHYEQCERVLSTLLHEIEQKSKTMSMDELH